MAPFDRCHRRLERICKDKGRSGNSAAPDLTPEEVVGLGRLERPTSPLSGVRSNHLSYRPETGMHL
jgi:hypothetical protein